jgi:prepilin-type N-terminal cleavage/methylation domain-containing protein
MFIKPAHRSAGWTLLEMMIGVTVFSVASAAVGTAYLFSLRSFQALSNYSILDQQNREAIDLLTREIRQANSVSSYSTNFIKSLSLVDADLGTVTYSFDPLRHRMLRTKNGMTQVLLTNCSLINFNLGMRPPSTNYGYYPTASLDEAKIVDLTWKTSRSLPGGVVNSEDVQTARIVIRKQKLQQ